MAAQVLAKDTENVFRCGISVAPVTNWKLYGKILIHKMNFIFVVEQRCK